MRAILNACPWASLDVDIVFECSGAFTRRKDLESHIRAGARYVILLGTDEQRRCRNGRPWRQRTIGWCNRRVLRQLHDELRAPSDRDPRSARWDQEGDGDDDSRVHVEPVHHRQRPHESTAWPVWCANLVPTSTGAAAATVRALPDYLGLFDGLAVRARIPAGSLADIVAVTTRSIDVTEINRIFTEEAASPRYRGILG